MAAEARNE